MTATGPKIACAIFTLSLACAGPVRAGLPIERPRPEPPPTRASFESRSLEDLLRSRPRVAEAVERAAEYRFQVLVSVPEANGTAWHRRQGFRVDAEYFYPASALKPCIALAALETLSDLRSSAATELDPRASFTSERRRGVTIGQLVSGALIASDNDASDDLLELAGFDGLHERMWRMGLSSVRVRHRMGLSTAAGARSSGRVELVAADDVEKRSPVAVAPRESTVDLGKNEEPGVEAGESFFAGGRIVDKPMSFEEKNRISLVDLQDLMVAMVRPDLRLPDERPHLGESERSALVDALTMEPQRWGMTPAAEIEHKPLLRGLERVRPRRNLTIASKSGRAYGFIVDNAYVLDKSSGRSFFLTVALYANANRRLNDDQYEYDSVAYPVIADLGEVVARNVFDDPG